MPLPPIVGSYQPLLELASGGMASVYAVRLVGASGFERIVVMKRVHPHLVGNGEFREMFLDEARLSSLIRHPNVVPVIDVAEEKGELFLIMEYIESISLAQLLRTLHGERLSPPIAARIVCDVLAGLHAAHEALDLRGNAMNIIHRDVSPQNIIVGVDGTSRLIDFGIAKASSRLTPTTNGMLKGKFGYMAPEQIRQQALDRRVDIFAAGVVLHEALTSARVFAAGNTADALLGVLIREVPDPSSIVEGLPTELDEVVHRALARDKDERFATAADFAAAVEAICPPARPREVAELIGRVCMEALSERRRTLQAAFERPTVAVAVPVIHPEPFEVTFDPPVVPATGKRRRIAFGIGALVGTGLVALLWVTLAGQHAPPAETATGPAASAAPEPSAVASPPPPVIPVADTSPAPRAPLPVPSLSPRPAPATRPLARPPRSGGDIHKNNPYLNP